MHRFNQAQETPLSFGVVKAILRHFGVTPDTDGALAPSARLFWPLVPELAQRVRTGTTSLTDASTSQEQIRFFQRHRTRRAYIKIANDIVQRCGAVTIAVGNCFQLDEPSREFLSVASEVCGWSVNLTPTLVETPERSTGWSPEEEELLRNVHPERIEVHLDDVWRSAFEYINVGDAWTGVALGRLMSQHEQTPRVWNLMALGYAMLGQTENAEFYYRRWAADGDDLDMVRAYYGIAMLYARHHFLGLRNLDTAEKYLTSAYELLRNMSPSARTLDTIVFEEVFNRNGLALILFRRREVDSALSMLEWGISRLSETSEKVAIHRSVLMYNLAQCHRQLGDREASVAAYERLLAVDPFMPEYRFEAAKCHADRSDLPAAIATVRSGLELDDCLASGWSLLGVYLLRDRDVRQAVSAFEEALRLEPLSSKYALDLAYALLLLGRPQRARDVAIHAAPTSQDELERQASLLAESWLQQGDPVRAEEEIESLSREGAVSDSLARNLVALRAR